MSVFFTNEIAKLAGLSLLTVKSNALKKRADITVFCPQTTQNLENLPLVILLHGVYGSHWAWTALGKVHETFQRLIEEGKCRPMLLAMPSDGLYGDGSAYVSHRAADYEKWIVEDVIEAVKDHFAEVKNSAVFIAGLSMGGFGALRLGAKYPQIFKAFSGLSSITHFSQMEQFVEDFAALKNDATEQDGVLDWLVKNKEILPPFRFDCGDADVLLEHNRELHQALEKNGISHEYFEYEGGHSWEYWQTHIEETLLFFNENREIAERF